MLIQGRTQALDFLPELNEMGRRSVASGMAVASSGNFSVRIPHSDELVITTKGAWLDQLGDDDVVRMTMQGEWDPQGPEPSSEWKLHQRTYRQRPDVTSIVHLHPQYAVLLDAAGISINLIFMDHAFYVGSIGRVGFFPNGSDELADQAATQARSHDAVVLAFHGCLAVGDSIAMAFRRALNLEQAAQATYRAHLLGHPGLRFPGEHLEQLRHQ